MLKGAQNLADAITKRLSDMTDAELVALEARMITIPGSLALEHVDEPQADGDTDAGQDGDGCADDVDGASFKPPLTPIKLFV